MNAKPSNPAGIATSAPRRLRVAVLIRQFSVTGGGAERYAINLVEQLSTRHEIHVFAQQIDHSWPGVNYHQVLCLTRRPRWLNQLWYATATWCLTRKGFDIVHSHENTWHGNVQTFHVKSVRGNLLADYTGWRYFWRCVKLALNLRLASYLLLERCRCRAARSGAALAVSPALAAQFSQQYGNLLKRISVIPPAVQISPLMADQQEARCALGSAHTGSIILFVANDYARKGLAALLQAFAQLPVEVELWVVGRTQQKTRFQMLAETLEVAERVRFLGPLDNMAAVYRAADVLAHPTLEDSFGMVVLEAMAYGLAVVLSSSAYCGVAALLRDQMDAWLLTNPQDVDELKSALSCLLSDAQLRQRLIANAAQLAAQHSWSNTALAYEAVYHEFGTNAALG